MPKLIDLTGKRFGRLTVIDRAPNRISKCGLPNVRWNCVCDCGNEVTVDGSSLRNGHTQSCGCYHLDRAIEANITHGDSHGGVCSCKNRLYSVWCNMKSRCMNHNNKRYYRYGGRGITICKEWIDDYASFRQWSYDNGYQDNLTLDRVDNNEGYSPDNCRWVTYKDQANNTSRNVIIEYDGEEKTLMQWSEYLGISYNVLKSRIFQYDWSIERAFTEPVNEPRIYYKRKNH